MFLAIIDIIPPLPSLWAILLLVASGVLWKTGRTGLALIPGGLGALFLIGWVMSVMSWVIATALTLAVMAAVVGGAYWLVKGRKKDKNVVDSTATATPSSIDSGAGLPDIDAMLAEMARERQTVRRS